MTTIASLSGSKKESTKATARFGGRFDKKSLTALWLLFIHKTNSRGGADAYARA
jgi:hypothetical protein